MTTPIPFPSVPEFPVNPGYSIGKMIYEALHPEESEATV